MASRPKVVIVGGGIGGLFAANALIAHGLHVTVHEQASALGEIGAGVFVTPNAVRHLERVGLARPSSDGARASGRVRTTSGTTGRRSRRSRSPTPPAGMPSSACTGPTRRTSSPPNCPTAWSTPVIAPSASSRTAMRRA